MQLVQQCGRSQSGGAVQGDGSQEGITKPPFLLSPDVEIKLDEGGFVLPASVDEDVYGR